MHEALPARARKTVVAPRGQSEMVFCSFNELTRRGYELDPRWQVACPVVTWVRTSHNREGFGRLAQIQPANEVHYEDEVVKLPGGTGLDPRDMG